MTTMLGYLDERITGGAERRSVRFRVIVSPTSNGVDELIMPCRIDDAAMAAEFFAAAFRVDDLVQVTGHLHGTGDGGLWLHVFKIHRLDTAPVYPTDTAARAATLHLASDDNAGSDEAKHIVAHSSITGEDTPGLMPVSGEHTTATDGQHGSASHVSRQEVTT
ncbi:hypothetical protein ACFV3E_36585 [Streptomyces sp. NPDC059718]